MDNIDIIQILEYIDPGSCSYQEWINVGMALKYEGYSPQDWETWSQRDGARYHKNECYRKWNTFEGSSTPVTAGTIVQMAKDRGFTFQTKEFGSELDWDSVIEKDDLVIVDKNWIEGKEIKAPEHWSPSQQLITYLETLFDSTDNVGYVTTTWQNEDGKYLPNQGNYDRTAGELIQELHKYKDDIGAVFGDYNKEAGAWIRFNPLDGKGVKNDNVTDFRYALVESDSMEIEKQNAIIRELELPVACLVHSGKKSLHAIVRIDAADYPEYKKRVDYLYTVCKKNGLEIDQQNRNPSRLSRMPGVIRNGQKQFLIDTNIGKANWNEWKEWVEAINDDLPDFEALESVWSNLPTLSNPLIDGILRQGHKMLIAGPSKAGKSFALIELTIAIAEGKQWFGWQCTKGRIMYVNLELDRPSCLHRFKDVYASLGWEPNNLSNIDIWNLRGKSLPMDKLAPKLIRRAMKKNYIAIIIDPIYKVITGDENSADQMANFCNQFDKVCTELGCAVIYCHHHSKGSQGNKRSMDRASGSGVFARDPDALLDLIELELSDDLIKNEINMATCSECQKILNRKINDWADDLSQDDCLVGSKLLEYCKQNLDEKTYHQLNENINKRIMSVKTRTGWRIEGTLREFPKFAPLNLWFEYPVHNIDKSGILNDIQLEDNQPPWKKAIEKRKDPKTKLDERKKSLDMAFESLNMNGEVTIKELEEYFTLSKNAIKNRVKEHGGFEINNGIVTRK